MGRRGLSHSIAERLQRYQDLFDTFDPVRSFTQISTRRLNSIAEGAKPSRSEIGKLNAFARRLEVMNPENASETFRSAAERLGVSEHALLGRAQEIGGQRTVLTLLDIANEAGVDFEQVWNRSKEPIKSLFGKEVKPPRGIEWAHRDRKGRLIAKGEDGETYIPYVVRHKTTGESRFFWGRLESVGAMLASEFAQAYMEDGGDYEIDIGLTGLEDDGESADEE